MFAGDARMDHDMADEILLTVLYHNTVDIFGSIG